MLIDPNDFVLSIVVAFGIGVIAGILWFTLCDRQPRDSKGRFTKR